MATDTSYNEKELLFRISLGEEKAFAALVKKYSGLLYTYLFKIVKDHDVAGDVVQEIFTQLWLTRESLTKVESFRSYLFVISRNHAIRLLKNIDKEQESLRQWWHWKGETAHSPVALEDVPAEAFDVVIREAINRLPPQQQKAWLLSRRDGRKYAEIAAEMNISRESVKKYLQIASASIADYIKQHGLPSVLAYLVMKL